MRHSILLSIVLALSSFGLGSALSGSAQPGQEGAAAEESDAERHERLVRELIEVTKVRENQEQALAVQMEAFDMMPFLPEGFAEEFAARFDHDWFIEESVKVFLEHLEPETLEAALVFYRSEQGKVLVDAQVDIAVELIRIGQAYGEKLGQEVAEDLTR
ncbi:MAG: DUF2059 domain-containing protein [Planctomycetaceae bacterium]|nr:DUF2059 domain-containing protein [Planctomycetaceae bacterium]